MEKGNTISIRLNDEELVQLQKNAYQFKMKKSEYIREKCCYEDNWISKQSVITRVEKITQILDRYEMTDKNLIKKLRKEVEKFWQILL